MVENLVLPAPFARARAIRTGLAEHCSMHVESDPFEVVSNQLQCIRDALESFHRSFTTLKFGLIRFAMYCPVLVAQDAATACCRVTPM